MKGYLTLYACIDNYTELEAFLKRKSRELLDETVNKDKIPSNLSNLSGRMSWKESLKFLRRARASYLSLVEKQRNKKDGGK